MELSIHCYTALALKTGYKFGYMIPALIVTVYNPALFLSPGSSFQISAKQFIIFSSTVELLCCNVTNKYTSNTQY